MKKKDYPVKGKFIRLEEGKVHYQLEGDEKGKTVVLVHGFAGHSYVWNHNFEVLVENGFRVLRYDLFGRGHSDKPAIKYKPDLFMKQLQDLLNGLSIEGKVNLVGVSMGGAISALTTHRHPELVEKLCLIAPFGFKIKQGIGEKLLKLPLAGDIISATLGKRIIYNGSLKAIHKPALFPGFKDDFAFHIHHKGFQKAILSSFRNFIANDYSKEFYELGKINIPMMLCWGTKDKVLPFSYGEKIRQSLPNASFHVFEDTGHLPHFEESDKFNALLIDFLR